MLCHYPPRPEHLPHRAPDWALEGHYGTARYWTPLVHLSAYQSLSYHSYSLTMARKVERKGRTYLYIDFHSFHLHTFHKEIHCTSTMGRMFLERIHCIMVLLRLSRIPCGGALYQGAS